MKRRISTQELKSKIGEYVDAVRLRGDLCIIERRGKPVAALVPMSVVEARERQRKEFFDLIERVAERNRDVPDEEIAKDIEEAIAEVRREKRERLQRSDAA